MPARARTSLAERQARWRERQRGARRAVLPVSVEIDALVMALVEDQFLASEVETDRSAITAAVEKMIETYVASMIGTDTP
jgi:hypothetical protein